MNIREMAEQREADYLSIYASLSRESRGREREEPPCDIRPHRESFGLRHAVYRLPHLVGHDAADYAHLF